MCLLSKSKTSFSLQDTAVSFLEFSNGLYFCLQVPWPLSNYFIYPALRTTFTKLKSYLRFFISIKIKFKAKSSTCSLLLNSFNRKDTEGLAPVWLSIFASNTLPILSEYESVLPFCQYDMPLFKDTFNCLHCLGQLSFHPTHPSTLWNGPLSFNSI